MAIRSKIDPKYLFYFLRLQFLNGKFMSNSTQTTNIANINSATLGETETPIPPLEEQKRIVVHIETLFAKLDEAKEKAMAELNLSFDDDFDFVGTQGDAYKMIGNAVPVKLASAIALSVAEILDKYN